MRAISKDTSVGCRLVVPLLSREGVRELNQFCPCVARSLEEVNTKAVAIVLIDIVVVVAAFIFFIVLLFFSLLL